MEHNPTDDQRVQSSPLENHGGQKQQLSAARALFCFPFNNSIKLYLWQIKIDRSTVALATRLIRTTRPFTQNDDPLRWPSGVLRGNYCSQLAK